MQEKFSLHRDPAALLCDHAALIDSVLQSIWQRGGFPDSLALIAVGGYGRREQYPHSDVDLLVLLESAPDAPLVGQLEALIGLLWDVGLDVGHSVRTLDECVEESARDVTVQTNLLEMRFLAGNAERFGLLKATLFGQFGNGAFFQSKTLEQQQRHARFNDTAYNLEPNIKENPGGLRDLQTVIWLSQSLGLGHSWKQLADQGLITQQEARQVRRHEKFLQGLRVSLHYLAKRREDRLLFDFQEKMAQGMGIAPGRNRSASEMLMQHYYRTAKAINLMNEILLLNLRSRLAQNSLSPSLPSPLPLNAHFQMRGDLLEACDENVFQDCPSAILECFLLLQKHRNLSGFCAPTLRSLWRALPLMNTAFRQNDENRRLFLDILREPNGLTHVIRKMNQYGILGRYIPAFGKIVGQMQHDLFHVYTVDEHTLMVVRNLRRYTVPEFSHEFPLCSSLMASFEKPELLYIAGLFHDIAKGRGGDHSRLGRADAKRFCQAHRLLPEETGLIVWLVESHLNMSAVAQKQDISDPDVIAAFANTVRDKRRLTALYLLTVSDIRGTSPKVWNAWKARLLESLYHATCRYLCGVSSTGEQLQARQAEALALLRQQAVPETSARQLWNKLDEAYFLRHDAQEIAWHTRVLCQKTQGGGPIVAARVVAAQALSGQESGGGLQVMIYTPDRDDLFARICGFFEQVNFNIVEAKIHTTHQGYALDSFVVLDEEQRATHYRDMLNYIEFELGKQLLETPPLQAPLRGRISRHLKHFPIAPQVSIRPDDKGSYHVLSVTAGDRPGLLSGIARVFLARGIHLHTAKINTLGERAEDTFLVSGTVLSKNNEIIVLENDIIKQLQA